MNSLIITKKVLKKSNNNTQFEEIKNVWNLKVLEVVFEEKIIFKVL